MAIRPIRTSSSFDYVASIDPSIDWAAVEAAIVESKKLSTDEKELQMSDAEFLTHKKNQKTLKILKDPTAWKDFYICKSGERFTVFEVGTIPVDELVKIYDEFVYKQRMSECAWRCFLSAVRNIKEFASDIPKEGDRVKPSWLKETFVRSLQPLAIEVGWAAFQWNKMGDEEIKN
jgi:hypothetical protein